MTTDILPDEPRAETRARWLLAALEVVCIALLFAAQAAWPPPDVNEPHYLGKAKHFWNPDWAPGDFFFNSADTHRVFYVAIGWLTRWLELSQVAWCGRLATWALLAWAWRRLSWTVAPKPGWAIVSGAIFLSLNAGFQMAGEWVVGGFEAKGLAYVLVFVGLAELARGRWNASLALCGAASALHVLVGGWSAVAIGCAWLLSAGERPPLVRLWPGVAGGLLLALPGLLPGLALNAGVDAETAAFSHEIYVFKRLRHHLVPQAFPAWLVAAQLAMVLAWLSLAKFVPRETKHRAIRNVVLGALLIELAGVMISLFAEAYPVTTASLLRLYWFRLVDAMLPLGIALAAAAAFSPVRHARFAAAICLVASIALAGLRSQEYAISKGFDGQSRADKPGKVLDAADWRAACRWAATNTPADALFLTPRNAQSFTWHAGRGQVASWKDVPQDARAIVEWWRRQEEIYGSPIPDVEGKWLETLSERRPDDLRRLGAKYHARYLLTEAEPQLALPLLYQNNSYAVYDLGAGVN